MDLEADGVNMTEMDIFRVWASLKISMTVGSSSMLLLLGSLMALTWSRMRPLGLCLIVFPGISDKKCNALIS